MGSIYSKKNKIYDPKINNNKFRRKSDSNTSKNLIFSSTISTNYSINFGNTLNKVTITNHNLGHNLEYKNTNETKKNYLKTKNNLKIMKSIEALMNIGDKKRKLYNEKELNRVFKLKSDSHKTTKMSINIKNNHTFLCIDKILSQIKNTIKKNTNKSKTKNNNKNKNHNYYKKDNEIKNKISSYECKPYPEYFQKDIYVSKIQIKKQRTSTLIKNKKMENYFTSKDFYNLKLNNNNVMRTSQNMNNSKIKYKYNIKRNIKSNNKNYEKSKLDINYIDSNSLILKTFNKENNYQCQYENYNITKDNNNQLFFNHFNFEKLKEKYSKYLYKYTSKDISYDKSNNYYFLINKHKKTHTTNICKNIEEINTINKIKENKDILRKHKRNKITILNNPMNNNNIKLQLNYKPPSKNIIKSLKMKNNIITNNINFRDKLNINNINSHLLHLNN